MVNIDHHSVKMVVWPVSDVALVKSCKWVMENYKKRKCHTHFFSQPWPNHCLWFLSAPGIAQSWFAPKPVAWAADRGVSYAVAADRECRKAWRKSRIEWFPRWTPRTGAFPQRDTHRKTGVVSQRAEIRGLLTVFIICFWLEWNLIAGPDAGQYVSVLIGLPKGWAFDDDADL